MSIFHTLSAMAAAGLELVLYLIGWLLVALLVVYGLGHQIILHAVGIARRNMDAAIHPRVDSRGTGSALGFG